MRLKSKAESTFPDKVVKVSVYMFVLQQDLIRHWDTGTLFFDNIAFPYFKGLPVTLVTVSLLSIPEWPQWTEKETRRPVPSHPWLGDPFPMSPIRYQQQHRIRGVFSVTFTGGNVSCPLFIKHFCPVANLFGEKYLDFCSQIHSRRGERGWLQHRQLGGGDQVPGPVPDTRVSGAQHHRGQTVQVRHTGQQLSGELRRNKTENG